MALPLPPSLVSPALGLGQALYFQRASAHIRGMTTAQKAAMLGSLYLLIYHHSHPHTPPYSWWQVGGMMLNPYSSPAVFVQVLKVLVPKLSTAPDSETGFTATVTPLVDSMPEKHVRGILEGLVIGLGRTLDFPFVLARAALN